MATVKKSSEIKVRIGLDDKNVPVRMDWGADDANGGEMQECKAMLLSIFDKKNQDTLKIDLWTTEMQVQEMDRFFYQTLRGLADTYFRATQNKELAADMQRFMQYFGEKTEILPKNNPK